MRQKIYRVWAGGKMHFPAIITFDTTGAVFSPDGSGGGSWRAEFKDVCEPTGLCDKNGREIYEGDILCWPQYEGTKHQNRWAVVWEPHCAWTYWHPRDGAEVIGNVHSNPDLLK